jgi:hypothetical protein
MGEFHGLLKMTHMDFITLLLFIIIIFLPPNTMGVYHGILKPWAPWARIFPMLKGTITMVIWWKRWMATNFQLDHSSSP